MNSLRKKLKMLAKVGLATVGFWSFVKPDNALVDEATGAARDYISMKKDIPDVKGQINENMPQKDRERLEQLLDIMAKTPHGRELIRSLGKEGTQLDVVDSFDRDSTLGQTMGKARIDIKRENLYSSHAIWTLAHEATHVQNKVNFSLLPQTLDDAHTLNIIDEALAERNAFIVLREVMRVDPDFITQDEYRTILEDKGYGFLKDQKILVKRTDSKKIFKDRMTNTAPSEDWIRGYELQSKDVSRNASMKRIFSDDPDLVLNPNWDKVVQVMSNGEVSSVPCLPVPTWTLIGDMIVDANVYGECAADTIDLSCAKQHKTELLKGDAFKIEIFNRMKDLFCYQLHIEDKTKVSEVLKEIMPDSYLNNLKQGSWVGSLQHTVEGKEFLSKQNNIGYLNKALKALKSPEFQELANRNEASKLNIEETQLILNTYKQVFFGKDEKSIVRNNPKALQNVHL